MAPPVRLGALKSQVGAADQDIVDGCEREMKRIGRL